jgi:hypothetical protein
MRPALIVLTCGVGAVVAGLAVAAYALAGVLAAVATGLIAAGVPAGLYGLFGMDVEPKRGERR